MDEKDTEPLGAELAGLQQQYPLGKQVAYDPQSHWDARTAEVGTVAGWSASGRGVYVQFDDGGGAKYVEPRLLMPLNEHGEGPDLPDYDAPAEDDAAVQRLLEALPRAGREIVGAETTGPMRGERPRMIVVDEMSPEQAGEMLGRSLADWRGRMIAAGSPDGPIANGSAAEPNLDPERLHERFLRDPRFHAAVSHVRTISWMASRTAPLSENDLLRTTAMLERMLATPAPVPEPMTRNRLTWWASRIYDALEFNAYTVDTDGQIDGHRDKVWTHDDPLEDTLRAFMTELGLPYPEEN